LRIKSKDDLGYLEIYLSLKKFSNLNIIINDRWELALKENSFGLHLGKEDYESLENQAKIAIKNSSFIKGISSHSIEDIQNLENFWSYSGIGPLFHTITKNSPYNPIGISNLSKISEISPLPLVAIGGISLENIKDIAGIKNVIPASISLFSQTENFSEIVKKWSENMT
jgi:thiamine-phosphate pyrophosphorylase